MIAAGFTLGLFSLSASELASRHAVSYQLARQTDYRQRLSVERTAGQLGAHELRPQAVLRGKRFHYRYHFPPASALSGLSLDFQERRMGSLWLAAGWRLNFRMNWNAPLSIDPLSPALFLQKNGNSGVIATGGSRLPVQRRESVDTDDVTWESTVSHEGRHYWFLEISSDAGQTVLPYAVVSSEGKVIRFHYGPFRDSWILKRISSPQGSLYFHYSAQGQAAAVTTHLSSMELQAGDTRKHWRLIYEQPSAHQSRLLTRIEIQTHGSTAEALRFSYGRPQGSSAATAKRIDWCDPDLPKSSAWLKQTAQDNGGRWKLPRINGVQAFIQFHPGLRFMDLDLDGQLDLVNTEEDRLSSWLWVDAARQWVPFDQTYKPKQASVLLSRRPSGSHYVDLPRRYDEHNFNTFGFQSILTSMYQPAAATGGRTLEYRKVICFPPVKHGKLDPGRDWDCDSFSESSLFPPLQFHNRDLQGIWPIHLEGTQGIESYFNQGSQWVQFSRDGKLNLLYIGLRYVDIGVNPEQVLLTAAGQSAFRDTENCRVWKPEVHWENKGQKRRVRIDLCQAFWTAKSTEWREDNRQDFWERGDLLNQEPVQWYILPWQDDNPDLYAAYHTFTGIKFAQLEPEQTHVIIQGPESFQNPRHRAMYHLSRPELGEWTEIGTDSPLYLPQPAWRSEKILFHNIGDGWADDIILRSGKVLINREEQPGNRWQHCPAFDLPIHCDPFSGGCMVMDLDDDDQEYQDLFIGSGETVYINQAELGADHPHPLMTVFTDETGAIRKVARSSPLERASRTSN